MTYYTLELSEIEKACGVTLEKVAEILPKGYFTGNGEFFVLPKGTDAATASATARSAFATPAEFSHLIEGYPVYKRANA